MLRLIISRAEMIVSAANTQQIGDLSNVSGYPIKMNMNLRKLSSDIGPKMNAIMNGANGNCTCDIKYPKTLINIHDKDAENISIGGIRAIKTENQHNGNFGGFL